ncbi:hypothetical protein BTA35_0214905 [Oceanospirillum linum]|uniref:Type III pantothenate kinase n=2 Tax=Oceanospirillum linum TaxID=966 RepID=A0A1T1H841_OCELI|nr:type III pantothenate kinase [Oceanospirillum linum]OOV86031.1 hypothetical protein BTA35_0214905 [Oceanospirillum linum]SEG40425.1 pantothenate kinase [Oleiphilus messinensis]SMP33931.1 pantothenate kinase [Oceanospirillum linum]
MEPFVLLLVEKLVSELSKLLLVDVGNTRIKFMAADSPEIKYADSFDSLPLQGVNEVRVATVSRHKEIANWSQSITPAVRVARVTKCHKGLTVAYDDESRLGVDRWLAMLALWVENQKSFSVIDLGTAITADFVDDTGMHLGGYITPGYRLMKEALGVHTAQVGFGGNSSRLEPGHNTECCVDHGINRMVFSWLADIQHMESEDKLFVLTGGDAEKALEAGYGLDAEIDRTLVIRGLRYCFE